MHWVVLVASGIFEAVWATALSKAEGLTRLVPSLVFVAASLVSLCGLAYALREIPVGTGYAVWTAIGAAATAIWAMMTGAETVDVLKIVFIFGIVACVAGLKFTGGAH